MAASKNQSQFDVMGFLMLPNSSINAWARKVAMGNLFEIQRRVCVQVQYINRSMGCKGEQTAQGLCNRLSEVCTLRNILFETC
jgi:hypothetical protein